MKIAGISIVKNECDVIEVFVRHNLQYLDRLFVVDNLSTDTTARILALVKDEGLPIEILACDKLDHSQRAVLTQLLPAVAAQGFDYVFPLDADEFIVALDRDHLHTALQAIPPGRYGSVPWRHYVLRPEDDMREPNILRRMTCRVARDGEPPWFAKAVVPCRLIRERGVALGPGNHTCIVDGQPSEPAHRLDGIALAHFPARSESQFLTKIIVGEFSLRSRAHRGPGEGVHWFALYEQFRNTLSVPRPLLHDVPIKHYTSAESAIAIVSDSLAPAPEMRFAHLVEENVLKRVYEFADAHFRRLSTTKLSHGNVSIGRTAFGIMAYLESDSVIGRSIRLYGEWAWREVVFLKQYVQHGHCIVDVGANIGTHAVPLAMAVGATGAVIALEPQRIPFQILCANAVLNNLRNVRTINAGAGDVSATLRVPVTTDGNIGATQIEGWDHGEAVQVVPLDAIPLPPIHLIKIDVEGMERKVLDGARDTISRYRPLLFVENNIRENSAALISRLLEFGYECWWHLEPYYNPHNLYGNTTNIFPNVDRPEINLFCAPKERGLAPPPALTKVTGPDDDWRRILAPQR